MASDWQDDEGLPDKRPDHRARRQAERRTQVLRRRIVAIGSIVVVAVAVVIVISSAGSGDSGDKSPAKASQSKAAHQAAAESKPESQEVRNATPQADWKPNTGPVPILEYHDLGSPPEGAPYPELFVGRTDFAKQMDWLEEHGYQAVTLEQVQEAWYDAGKLPPKPIVLSFDDGYRPQFTFALPTLRKHGWAGVLNLKAEGSDLYESNVKAMIAAGWELAAHTIHHLDLTELGPGRTRRRSGGLAQDPAEGIQGPGEQLLLSGREVRRNGDRSGRSGGLHRRDHGDLRLRRKGQALRTRAPGDPARIARRRPRRGPQERRRRNHRRRRLAADRNAVGGEALLCLRHSVLPVVEDRGA